jgi:hypothetical protein
MSNVKAQSSNEAQNLNVKKFLELIHLTFACLPADRDFEIWNWHTFDTGYTNKLMR